MEEDSDENAVSSNNFMQVSIQTDNFVNKSIRGSIYENEINNITRKPDAVTEDINQPGHADIITDDTNHQGDSDSTKGYSDQLDEEITTENTDQLDEDITTEGTDQQLEDRTTEDPDQLVNAEMTTENTSQLVDEDITTEHMDNLVNVDTKTEDPDKQEDSDITTEDIAQLVDADDKTEDADQLVDHKTEDTDNPANADFVREHQPQHQHQHQHQPCINETTKNQVKLLTCDLCPRTFQSYAERNYHLANHDRLVYKCLAENCGFLFQKFSTLVFHYIKDHKRVLKKTR